MIASQQLGKCGWSRTNVKASRLISAKRAFGASKTHKVARRSLRPVRTVLGSSATPTAIPQGTSTVRYRCLSSPTATKDAAISEYKPPTTGLLSLLPPSFVPYAELSRYDKPAGWIYLFFPCAFSTFLAAPLASPNADPTTTVATTLLFMSGAVIMRGAGCTINDLWDRDFDPQVARTRLRPIARGAVKPLSALVYAGFQCLAGLMVLLQFPTPCLWYGIPSLILVGTYPLAKRVTHYPQVVLGLAFSWGAIMGFPALGVDLLSDQAALAAVTCLYASCVSWTVLYDMIYAHMDIKDDTKAGVKSIALRHEQETKPVLAGLMIAQITLLASAGWFSGAGPLLYVGSCGGAFATIGTMIWKVNLKDPSSCWWWFRNGCLFTGASIVSGLALDYWERRSITSSAQYPRAPAEDPE